MEVSNLKNPHKHMIAVYLRIWLQLFWIFVLVFAIQILFYLVVESGYNIFDCLLAGYSLFEDMRMF